MTSTTTKNGQKRPRRSSSPANKTTTTTTTKSDIVDINKNECAITITTSSSIKAKVDQCLNFLNAADGQKEVEEEQGKLVVALTSKHPSAVAKTISIAEIIKRKLEVADGSSTAVGYWWQYTKLSSITVPWPPPAAVAPKTKKTASKKKRDGEAQEAAAEVQRQQDDDSIDAMGHIELTAPLAQSTQSPVKAATRIGADTRKNDGKEYEDEIEEEDEKEDDDENEFSYFQEKLKATNEPPKKIRALPIITIYISRHEINEYAKLYG